MSLPTINRMTLSTLQIIPYKWLLATKQIEKLQISLPIKIAI